MKKNIIRLIDKPTGISSFDVIRRLRETEGIRKAGHAGTLDPAASGLLIVGVGDIGTKKLNEFVKLDKTYEVTIELGVQTDTGDREGKVIKEIKIERLPVQEQVKERLQELVGEVELPVPRYSAVKVGGEPLYKKARRGEVFTPPTRAMQIQRLELTGMYEQESHAFLEVVMDVSSGVYVRSVVEEIGWRLGYPAMTASLRRTRVGEFRVEDAEQLNRVQ